MAKIETTDIGRRGFYVLLDVAESIPMASPIIVVLRGILKISDEQICNKEAFDQFSERLHLFSKIMFNADGIISLANVEGRSEVVQEYIDRICRILIDGQNALLAFSNQGFFYTAMTGVKAQKIFINIDNSLSKCIQELTLLLNIEQLKVNANHLVQQSSYNSTDIKSVIENEFGGLQGLCNSADNLKSLAGRLGIDVETLKQEISQYQEKMDSFVHQIGEDVKVNNSQLSDIQSCIHALLEQQQATSMTPKSPVMSLKNTPVLSDVCIGQGSFGKVVKGQYLGEAVAIKLITHVDISNCNVLRQLHREVAIHCELCSLPGIVRLYGANLGSEPKCVVMELADSSLCDVLYQPQLQLQVDFSVTSRLLMLVQLATAMHYVSSMGILHRDIKPSNVLLFVQRDTRVIAKLCDFGCARNLNTTLASKTARGTPAYMAPEVFEGSYSAASDVYAAAVLINEVFTECRPFDDHRSIVNEYQIQHRVAHGERPLMEFSAAMSIAERLRELIALCWHQSPSMRLSFRQMADVLHELVALESHAVKYGTKRDLSPPPPSPLVKAADPVSQQVTPPPPPAIEQNKVLPPVQRSRPGLSRSAQPEMNAGHIGIQQDSDESQLDTQLTSAKVAEVLPPHTGTIEQDEEVWMITMRCLYHSGKDATKLFDNVKSLARLGSVIAQFAVKYIEATGSQNELIPAAAPGTLLDSFVPALAALANVGNHVAKLILCECLEKKQGKIVKYAEEAAKTEFPPAVVALAHLYRDGKVMIGGGREAVRLYNEAAEKGYAPAQFCVGRFYEGKQDLVRALKFYREAAEQHFAEAERKLGSCYFHGNGVDQSVDAAIHWYGRGCNQRDKQSLFRAAEVTEQREITKAQRHYCMLIKLHYAPAEAKVTEYRHKNERQWSIAKSYIYGGATGRAEFDALRADSEREDFIAATCLALICCVDTCVNGLRKDLDAAVSYFDDASMYLEEECEMGNYVAMFLMGRACYFGMDGDMDLELAYEYYKKAADMGYAPALAAVGQCHMFGIGVTKEPATGFQYYRQAAEQQYSVGLCQLGICYMDGTGTAKTLTEAVRYFSLAADQHDSLAQYRLGCCYDQGLGVPPNSVEAVKYFRLAANQNEVQSLFRLGECYERGYGVVANQAEANRFYEQAASMGYQPAREKLRLSELPTMESASSVSTFSLSTKDHSFMGTSPRQLPSCAAPSGPKTPAYDDDEGMWTTSSRYIYGGATNSVAFDNLREIAKRGSYVARACVAVIMHEDSCYVGVRKDRAGAVSFLGDGIPHLTELALRGNHVAMFLLGKIYSLGIGCSKDYSQTVKWWNRAAEANYAPAHAGLGTLYASGGKGLEKSDAASFRHYKAAADRQYGKALYHLGVCYEDGLGVAKDQLAAVRNFQLAAEQGVALAQCRLGICYATGAGVTQSWSEAVKYYQLGANQHEMFSICRLAECYEKGTGVPKNLLEAQRYYELATDLGMEFAQKKLRNLGEPGFRSESSSERARPASSAGSRPTSMTPTSKGFFGSLFGKK